MACARFRRLIDHARQHVVFYKDRLPELPESVDPIEWLQQIPLTTKDDIESHFPDGVTDGSDTSGWRLLSTRGTAQRLITVQDFEKRDAVRAAQLRSLRLSGGYRPGMPMVEIPPEVCETVCGEEGEEEEGVLAYAWGMLRSGKIRDLKSLRDLRGLVERHWILNRKMYGGFGRYGSHPPVEVLDTYVHHLQHDRPYVLKALATYLTSIAKHIRDQELKPLSIPVIKTMGSRVTPNQRTLLEQSFGGKYWDDYGSAEFGSIACECAEHNGLHIFDDFFIVEVVDREGNRLPDGQRGWIVVTDLVNKTMPLIRYQIGDVGFMQTDKCSCGSESPRVTVEGRAHDVLVDQYGKWRTTDDVVDFLESLPGVDSGQVLVEGAGRYQVTVVPKKNVSLDRDEVLSAFAQWMGGDIRVEIQTATTLRPEAGGKFRYVRGDLEK